MSYSISIPVHPDSGSDQPSVSERIDTAVADYLATQQVPLHTEESISVAARAAIEVATSGAMGDADRIAVTLSGHANPDHVPAEGWSNDAITISLYQY